MELFMSNIPVEQAIYANTVGGYRFLARSPGFLDDWLPVAEQLCTGFGERPAGVACPSAVFAQPLGADHVVVVQVADRGTDDTGRPGALGFRLLVLPRQAYQAIGDPFVVAERFPPSWDARDLPTLSWPAVPLPLRTVAEVQHVLKHGDGPMLLGGVQSLVDGGRMVFVRPAPATEMVRDLWFLLPDRTRSQLWPASFAFGNSLGFDVVVLPRIEPGDCEGYLTEEQAGDYPQGRYELNLQIAAESGDQRQLDAQFARRSSADALRLALILIVVFAALAAAMNLINRATDRAQAPQPSRSRTSAPLLNHYPKMKQEERVKVGDILRKLLQERETPLASANPRIEEMLDALDRQLGTPDPQRDPGRLGSAAPGDATRQLRLLMWKQHVAGFDDERLNPVELAERLAHKLAPVRSAD
jgi:hypothetical protein